MRFVRSVWFTLVAAVLVAVASVPPRRTQPPHAVDTLTVAVREAEAAFREGAEQLRRAHSRVVGEQAVRSSPPVEFLTFSMDPTLHPVVATRIRNEVRAHLLRRVRVDTSVRIVVAAVLDSAPSLAGVPVPVLNGGVSIDVFPPGSIADNACVAVFRVHRGIARAAAHDAPLRDRDPTEVGSMLSPCVWYMTYGTPGPGMRALLDSTAFAPLTTTTFHRDVERGDYRNELSSWYYTESADWRSTAACLARGGGACTHMLAAPVELGPLTIVTPGWMGRGRFREPRGSPLAGAVMLRMERELGPSAFERVWKSAEPLERAFAAARGITLESSIREGAMEMFGPYPTRWWSPRNFAWWTVGFSLVLLLGLRALTRRQTFD